jgi:hypothetical protein
LKLTCIANAPDMITDPVVLSVDQIHFPARAAFTEIDRFPYRTIAKPATVCAVFRIAVSSSASLSLRRSIEMRRHEVRDEQWTAIEQLMPGKVGNPGRTGQDNRVSLNAAFWIERLIFAMGKE